jgi:hypothetical protein
MSFVTFLCQSSRRPKFLGDKIYEFGDGHYLSAKQEPRRISPAGLRLAVSRAYFVQQGRLTRQQPPPPQQSAEREVAFAVPISASAATIINRYFIESFR